MPELYKANRQVCDVDIRFLKNMKPFLDFVKANTTTVSLSGEMVYARAKGTNAIPFQDPIQGTLTVEAQVYPFKLFSAFSDGEIVADAVYAETETYVAAADGSLTLNTHGGTIGAGTVFVYPEDSYGDDNALIAGTYASGTFTATTPAEIKSGSKYKAAFLVTKSSGVKRVVFSNAKMPPDFYITMKTVDKDELGQFAPFLITAYKAAIQRNFELSFSSEGDPASVTMTFDLLEDKDGNVLDMVELDTADEVPAYTFTAVTPESDDVPATQGWFELVGYSYVRTEDTEVVEGKTYYERTLSD